MTGSIARVTDNWVQDLAFEVALEYFTPDDLQLKFDLSPEYFQRIQSVPAFRKAVSDYRREIDDEGIAFRLRARKAAEDILSELHAMAFDQTLDAKDRLKAMGMLCDYAGFNLQAKNDDSGIKLQIFTNLNMGQEGQQTYTIGVPNDSVQKHPGGEIEVQE